MHTSQVVVLKRLSGEFLKPRRNPDPGGSREFSAMGSPYEYGEVANHRQ